MEHLMIDIETFGNKSHSVIVSIGAVFFDLKTGSIGSVFYMDISAADCVKTGLKIDADTFMWWLKQSKEAQEKMVDRKDVKSLKIALLNLGRFISDYGPKDVKVWGNSARFDLGLLENAYDLIGLKIPWKHYNERDVRTLVSFAPEIKKNMLFTGVKHYAVDDCKHQIKYCSAIFNTLAHD